MKRTSSKSARTSAEHTRGLEPLLTVADVARRYSLSDWTVREWLKSGVLRGSRADGRWLTTWDAVFDFEGRLTRPRGPARERAKAPLLTIYDLASHFRRKPETIRRRLRNGSLSGRRIEGAWYADPDALETYQLAELRRRWGGDDAA